MEYIDTADSPDYGGTDKATAILKKYKEAKNLGEVAKEANLRWLRKRV